MMIFLNKEKYYIYIYNNNNNNKNVLQSNRFGLYKNTELL